MGVFDRLKAATADDWQSYVEHDFVRQMGAGTLPQAYVEQLNDGPVGNGSETRINRFDANGRLLHQRVMKSDGEAKYDVDYTSYDDAGNVLHEERARTLVSQKRREAVVRRDGRCRWPGCHRRLRLQVHHLQPGSWGGSDDVSNLAAVCPYHHALLIPHGDYVLEGNPNRPDGLTRRRISKEERERRRVEEAA